MVLRAHEGGRGTEEGSPQEARHTRPHPGPGREALVCPLYVPALPTGLGCLHSLAGKRVGREDLAGETPGPAGALRPALMRPSPVFPFLARCARGQASTGQEKTWGDWPTPLVPWPQRVIHSQWGPRGWHGECPALDLSGDACFFRPWF